MKKLMDIVRRELNEGRDIVLVTVVASSGSTPRGAGARMIINRSGRIYGTIGGGAVEYEAEKMSAALLSEKRSLLHDFILTLNQVQDLGMVCGGEVSVYFQYMDAKNEALRARLAQVLDYINNARPSWLLTALKGDSWEMSVVEKDVPIGSLPPALFKNDLAQVEVEGVRYFAEPLANAGFVYIFGGGHVARELVPVLHHIDFRCIVFEDRAEFATKELFPQAEKLIIGDFKAISPDISITENDYVVVMTRGHASDYDVERQVLATDACYIGVIGSRTKIKHVSEKLLADGFTEVDLRRIYSPIGLPIGGETPAEIAISIAAEMIQIRSGLAKMP